MKYVALKWERELIRIFERITRKCFERVIESLEDRHPFRREFETFMTRMVSEEKIPYYFGMMVVNDRTFIEKIYDPILKIGKKDITFTQENLLRTIASIIDPGVTMPSMRELLRHLTKMLSKSHTIDDFRALIPYIKLDLKFEGLLQFDTRLSHGYQTAMALLDKIGGKFSKLFELAQMKHKDEGIEFDILYLINFLYYWVQRDRVSINAIVLLVKEVLKKVPILQQAFTVFYLVFARMSKEALKNMASLIFMLIHQVKLKKSMEIKPMDLKIGNAIMSWLETIMDCITKDVSMDLGDFIEKVQGMIEETVDIFNQYGDDVVQASKVFGHHSSFAIAEIL